ncbi:MAG: aldo/keto reductase, partial [Veillonella sp.]|nr:aldo/keto reductase [Veillonella sp.]
HTNAGYDATMRAVESSLTKLNTNYIDIMLIHQPIGDYYGSWRAMEELYDQNVLRGLGLSNFYEDRLIDFLYHCNVKPVVNQIECHPFNQRKSLLEHMKSNFDVFDFKLSITDMDLMELLDQRAFLENHHTAAGLERILKLK